MDRNTILDELSLIQDDLDVAQRHMRLVWSRTAQNAGRETIDIARHAQARVTSIRVRLERLVDGGVFK